MEVYRDGGKRLLPLVVLDVVWPLINAPKLLRLKQDHV